MTRFLSKATSGLGLLALVGCAGAGSAAGQFLSAPRRVERPWQVLNNTMATTQMRLFAVRTDKAPAIDGRLDDAAWAKAFSVSTFGKTKFRGYTKRPNSARFLYDDKALYIGCTGGITQWADWLARKRPRDGGAWQDDAFEVFVDPGRTKKVYYQFIVNAVGSIQDGKGWNAKYNPDWKVAARHSDKSWMAEIAIPYAALETTAPRKGDVWGINVCRDDKEDKSASSVIPVEVSFHNPKKFAEIEFGGVPGVFLDHFGFDKIVKGENVLRFKALGSGVKGTKVRATVLGADGKAQGAAREAALVAGGVTEVPFAAKESGRSRLRLELLKGGKQVGVYELLAVIYEDSLLVLVPGQRDFYRDETSLNLRIDLRLKAEVLHDYRVKVALKRGGKVLRQGTIEVLPGVFTSTKMDISGLALGTYTIEAALTDKAGKSVDQARATINIIRGPFDRG